MNWATAFGFLLFLLANSAFSYSCYERTIILPEIFQASVGSQFILEDDTTWLITSRDFDGAFLSYPTLIICPHDGTAKIKDEYNLRTKKRKTMYVKKLN